MPEVQSGYSFFITDENENLIESIQETLTLDASGYSPYLMREGSMNVQPANSVIASVETWGIDVSAFFPLVQGCYLELTLAADLVTDVQEVQAGGFFMDDEDANTFQDWQVPNTKESGLYPYYIPNEKKLVFKGCG